MRLIAFLFLVVICIGCNQKPKLNFQFADLTQNISCTSTNDALLNEALHSFEQDIFVKYDSVKKLHRTAYARFITRGILGSEDYNALASVHSLEIRDALLEAGILITNGTKSNLNYTHPDVQCIINNMKDTALKTTINALIETNSMDPTLFDSRLRNIGSSIANKPYQATYIALDAYYQNLVNITLDTNE